MDGQNARLGILLMVAASFVFAVQDGVSRHLADAYNLYLIVMIRYWFFAAFVITIAMRRGGGLRRVAQSGHPYVQAFRAVLLIAEICVMVSGFLLDRHSRRDCDHGCGCVPLGADCWC